MGRTAVIPGSTPQSEGEELANSLTHGLGAALAVAALVLMVVAAATRGGARDVVGASIFGTTLVLLYLMSTLYHALRGPRAKLVFKVFDHSAIFLLIAGTYTPFCLSALARASTAWGWTVFGVEWGLAVLGITFKGIFYGRIAGSVLAPAPVDHLHPRRGRPVDPAFIQRMGWISTGVYLLMGWVIVVAAAPLGRALSRGGLAWLLAGGLLYSVGAGIYSLKRLPYHHALWHLFVVAGSGCHVAAVLFHALPGR